MRKVKKYEMIKERKIILRGQMEEKIRVGNRNKVKKGEKIYNVNKKAKEEGKMW